MRLKIYIWHNPTTEMPEKVYEFPVCCASQGEVQEYGRNMFSSKPLEKPVLFILPSYLTEIPNQRHTIDNEAMYAAIGQCQQMEQTNQL